MSDQPGAAGEQRALLARLRAVVEAKDAEVAVLRAELEAERELRRLLELRLAELERQLRMDSSDSGTPGSKERIGAKERRRAEYSLTRQELEEISRPLVTAAAVAPAGRRPWLSSSPVAWPW